MHDWIGYMLMTKNKCNKFNIQNPVHALFFCQKVLSLAWGIKMDNPESMCMTCRSKLISMMQEID